MGRAYGICSGITLPWAPSLLLGCQVPFIQSTHISWPDLEPQAWGKYAKRTHIFVPSQDLATHLDSMGLLLSGTVSHLPSFAKT